MGAGASQEQISAGVRRMLKRAQVTLAENGIPSVYQRGTITCYPCLVIPPGAPGGGGWVTVRVLRASNGECCGILSTKHTEAAKALRL